MARHRLLQLLCLAAAVAAACGSAGFRAELKHPYAGSPLSAEEMIGHSARASRARLARLEATTLARHLGGNTSVPLGALADQGYVITLGIGTPPQPQDLIIDTGSDLIWAQCELFRGTATLRKPAYDPAHSSSFAFLPCSSRLCREGYPGTKTCRNNKCVFGYGYGSAGAEGVLASDSFDVGGLGKKVFGCGNLTGGELFGASGVLGLSPALMSLPSQDNLSRFSYCLSPFADREATSHIFFRTMANLQGEVETTSILKNPVAEKANLFYYVPLIGLSLGSRRLAVPATSLELKPNGTGGTIIDSGSTTMLIIEPAFTTLKEAVLELVELPTANGTEDYTLCFALPSGVPMSQIKTPPLVLHFDGGAQMNLPQENYFQEPRPGLMCLAVGSSGFGMSIIGNVQQQNMHILFDVREMKLSFAPTRCDQM